MTTRLTAGDVAALRSQLAVTDGRVHLNHAGDSPSTQSVVDAQIEHIRREAEIGGYEAADERAADDAAVYESIARLLGCTPGEIARVEHATAAWNAGFWSLPMKPGQRILTAEAAYGANAVAYLHAEQVRGVTVHVIPSDESGQIDLDALRRSIDTDVAVVAITHIPTNGGLVNPAAEVGAIAREAGVPYLLDACQSVGQLDLDVNEIGCDLLSATGRKYLRGPRGTGFLYASDRIVDQLVPAQPDHHGADWTATRAFELLEGARRFEHWEYNHAAWLALGVAVDEMLAIGLERVEATVQHQAEQLRVALRDVGVEVHDIGGERCGIVTAVVPGSTAGDARAVLARAGINASITTRSGTRWDMERRGLGELVRLSVHMTTTDEEIERAARVLRGLVRP